LGIRGIVRPVDYQRAERSSTEKLEAHERMRMNAVYIVGGIVSLALCIYLVIALLKPEAFS
jgi:K+-transporting ATPase KdpF subunit